MINPFRRSRKTGLGLTPSETCGGSHERRATKRAVRRRYFVEELETRVCPTLPGTNWMGYVADAASLFQMSLPGTHDTMTGSAPLTANDLQQDVDSFINSNIPDALEDAYAVAWFLSLGSLPGGPDLRDDLDA